MLERKAGCLVNVASLAALAPTPYMIAYNASKSGLAAASEALRHELRGTGVHVLTVYPGPVHTPMADASYARYTERGGAQANLLPTGTPEALARRIVGAVERRRARLVYPSIYQLAAWFPGTARWVAGRLAPNLRR
jgi:short-subunit dehydrogenase